MDNQIGLLTHRTYEYRVKPKDLINEINNLIFELQIIQQSIMAIQNHEYKKFDCSIGDWKCQTRTSMLIDLMHVQTDWQQSLTQELLLIEAAIQKKQNFIQKIAALNPVQQQKLSELLQKKSLSLFLKEACILSYHSPHELLILGLSFITTVINHTHPVFTANLVSKDKFKKIINLAKQQLCDLSIAYTQKLSQEFGKPEEQAMLQQVETKAIQSMTCLFAEFKMIYKKMKRENQPFIMRQVFFCQCGGIQSIQNSLYTFQNGQYSSVVIHDSTYIPNNQSVITVIEAYQYPGSLLELQTKLNVSPEESDVPRNMYHSCQCSNPTPPQLIQDIDLAMMAFFAQHPQFTNLKPIDFEGLGLANSQIKKEYDYLLTLPGFSRLDMTIFHINHMYPSTIAAMLQESEEMVQAMIARQPAAPLMQSIKPAQKIQSIARHIANALCTHHCCVS